MHSMLSLVCRRPALDPKRRYRSCNRRCGHSGDCPRIVNCTAAVHGVHSVRTYRRDGIEFNGSTWIRSDSNPKISQERTMLDIDDVDEELQRGFGLSVNALGP